MDEEQHLSFFLEWYDPQCEQNKGYILHFYGDNTCELIERKTRKTFLKRIRVPTVHLNDLCIGASITIYSRQLTIIEAANEYTRNQLQTRGGKALFLIKPSGYLHMGKIIQVIEKAGLTQLHTSMVKLTREDVRLIQSILPSSTSERVVDELTQDVSILIEVKEPSSNMLEEVIGSLEEKNLSIYVYHGNSVPNLFANGLFNSTAVLDHCTLCIIKPRLVKEGKVGEILDTILKENYEISALKLVHLTTTEADEFFQVYKGIIRQYHEVVKYLSSSPCIVVEIRGENVVQKFRDLCGPFDVQIAKTLRPHCLRAKYGKNSLFNALHCTDCPEDGVLECQYFFQTLGG